jgi:hypothetical protein
MGTRERAALRSRSGGSWRALVLPALTAGTPVLCEWPLAVDPREAEEMARAAGRTRTFAGLQGRSSPAVRWLSVHHRGGAVVDAGYSLTVDGTEGRLQVSAASSPTSGPS